MPASTSTSLSPDFARRLARSVVNPVLIFAFGMLGLIWAAAWQQVETERSALLRDSAQETANLAIVFEQNIARSISDIDRLTMYLRESHERNGFKSDWASLIMGRFTVDEQALQIAVANADGILIASSLGVLPETPIPISDREHFNIHLRTPHDILFISKPIIGRVSGKWSVQLTRRIPTEDGGFGGVIVVSLDPNHLSRAYSSVDLGDGGGLVLYGTDDVIRAGAGVFAMDVGKGLKEGLLATKPLPAHHGTALAIDDRNDQLRIVGTRTVRGYPLHVMIAGRAIGNDPAWLANRRHYMGGAALLSIAVLLATLAALHLRRQHERQIMHLARHDSLTRLANRAQFRAALDDAIAGAAAERPVALHLLDLDRFKLVNDTYGHPVGDKLLTLVADRLRSNLRRDDLVARVGGDEFAIIQIAACSEAGASALAERMCRALSERYTIDGICIEIGVSIGIGLAPHHATGNSDIVKAADLALYSAKSEGRNRHRVFNSGMSAAVEARRALEADLRLAVERGQLELHYQPILDITTRTVRSYEALARWRHPTRGLVPPAEFIPIAEETGLIIEIGAWVLNRACTDMANRPSNIKVAVNFSPTQLKIPHMVDSVEAALQASGLPPSRLEIEITESTLMQNDGITTRQLRDLRRLGIQIALDDFGTGYSSLSYLQNYPINCIKIDRSFVKTLGQSDSAAAIVRAITTLASSLGMRTIAEGVETVEQLEELAMLGCTEAQGYYFSRPMPAAEILPPIEMPQSVAEIAA